MPPSQQPWQRCQSELRVVQPSLSPTLLRKPPWRCDRPFSPSVLLPAAGPDWGGVESLPDAGQRGEASLSSSASRGSAGQEPVGPRGGIYSVACALGTGLASCTWQSETSAAAVSLATSHQSCCHGCFTAAGQEQGWGLKWGVLAWAGTSCSGSGAAAAAGLDA